MEEGRKYCECHGHIFMDGADLKQAADRHREGVDRERIKKELKALSDAGVVYFRDGGDALGVSRAAREIAGEFGVRYASPLFAIHRTGRYGGIVGRGYSDRNGYRELVREVKDGGGDFVKIMLSGIITFRAYGELSCPSAEEEEIKALVGIAHDAGFPVMAHVNGDRAVRAAILAGTDSIEHGAFMEEETLDLLAASGSVWVPTAAAIAAFAGRDGFDRRVTEETLEKHLRSIRAAARKGAMIAAGSDSGAVGVPHGSGTREEYRLLSLAGVTDESLERGCKRITERFWGGNPLK